MKKKTDPKNIKENWGRVLRGGSQFNLTRDGRSAFRNNDVQKDRSDLIGLRLVKL